VVVGQPAARPAAAGAGVQEAAVAAAVDRVGLGWRPELASGILMHRDRVDCLEVLADDWLDKPPRAPRRLAAEIPTSLHGVGLGLASACPVDENRLARVAWLINAVEPETWSEHFAFVRAGGIEIGHLAAPPRTIATIEGFTRNLHRARVAVGSMPLMENVATLMRPPGELSEAVWIRDALLSGGASMLLDLHNLYANAANFDYDPLDFLAAIPLERVRQMHLAGGRMWRSRLLDDHQHDVPDPVYALLTEVAARVQHPLTVIIERDGNFPTIEHLLSEVSRAREALARGRAR